MKFLIVVAHPNPSSFNHAIVEAIRSELSGPGTETAVRDLYALKFDPVLRPDDLAGVQSGSVREDVRREQELIRSADVVIFVYPLWWSGMPAMLKGYIDRVFSYGFAYEITDRGGKGLLAGKKVFLVTTMGASEEDYRQFGMFQSFGQTVDNGIFRFSGMEVIDHLYFASVPYVSDEERRTMLDDVRRVVQTRLAAS